MMTQPTSDGINKILQPSDTFSLKDHDDFDLTALETKLEPINNKTIITFDSITSQLDLDDLVYTKHVTELNRLQDERAEKEQAWLDGWDEKIKNTKSDEERKDLMNLQSLDESDKRTVQQHYPKLRADGFSYKAIAILAD